MNGPIPGAKPAATASALALFAVSFAGLARTLVSGLSVEGDEMQWAHVVRHEERFLQALRSGTAAEGDDASC
jgi:hypothetical protein